MRGGTGLRAIDANELKRSLAVSALIEDQKTLEQIIDEQPTIEPKKGRWYKPNGVMPPEHFGRHRCSICDAFAMHDWKHHREQLTDFCPNCGADMRGDGNETD